MDGRIGKDGMKTSGERTEFSETGQTRKPSDGHAGPEIRVEAGQATTLVQGSRNAVVLAGADLRTKPHKTETKKLKN